jgi:tol-pal system protein YbgF
MNCSSSKPAKPIATAQVEPKTTRSSPTVPKPTAKDTTTVQKSPQVAPAITKAQLPEPAPAPQVIETLPSPDTLTATALTLPTDTSSQILTLDTTRLDTTTQYVVEDTVASGKGLELVPSEPSIILEESLLFDDIFFDEGQSAMPSKTMSPYYYATLSKVLKVWKNCPDCYLRVKGHLGVSKTERQAPELDLKRAILVGKLILGLFPTNEQEEMAAQIELIGAGFSELLVANADKHQDALNRRVSIELVKGGRPSKSLAEYLQTIPQLALSTPGKKTSPKQPVVRRRPISSTQALYDNALQLFEQKRYSEAIASFQELIEINPRHSLADNAQWWIGEAYYAQGEYQKALEAFQQVFDLGDGNKSAYAQLRLGYCYFHLEQKEAARTAFQKVIACYPQASEEVIKARRMLQSFAEK